MHNIQFEGKCKSVSTVFVIKIHEILNIIDKGVST
jgi:hypothetical protein